MRICGFLGALWWRDIGHCDARISKLMLIYVDRGYTVQVDRGRQRAWLMLALTILWIAIPASACLQAMQPTGQHACCHSMAQTCAPATMNADNSCCRVNPQNLAIHLALPYFSEHAQPFAFVSHPVRLPAPAMKSARCVQALAPVPPILTSADSSILRI